MQHRLAVPALIVAVIALLVALGGVGFTATRLPKGSVGSAQLRSGAVTGSKLAAGAVTGSKVRDGSLGGRDINPAGLAKVPAAASADTAAKATTAQRADVADEVDGQHVERVAATVGLGTTARVIGADGGLEVLAGCGPTGELRLLLRSTTAGALARASVVTSATDPADVRVVEDADLNPGEELTLFDEHGRGTAQIAYTAANGGVSTAVLGFGELTGKQTCTVAGTLVRAG